MKRILVLLMVLSFGAVGAHAATKPKKEKPPPEPTELAGTLDFLGKGPRCVPGDMNRKGAKAIWPVPRIPLINTMSEINAKSFGLPFETLGGTEFGEG